MITFLAKIFIKDNQNHADPCVRRAYGMLCGICGIVLNVLLFAFKYLAAVLSGSISIIADAFNNLSDAASSFITLIGFKFAGAAPDKDHPFGHGRIEYISGFAVSMLILLMAFELGKSSIEKIMNPEPIEVSAVTVIILLTAIAVKLYMFVYNRRIGSKINSPAMHATASDSLGDSVATAVVLLAALISHFFNVNIDGWCGVLVALFILYAGINAAKETLSPLLGQKPDPEFVEQIKETVMTHEEIIGIHDLVIHDYGPGRCMISLHGEVNGSSDIYELHDVIDRIEVELNEKFSCEAVIHMDPIAADNELLSQMRTEVSALVHEIDEVLTIHDFRMVAGPTHTNLIFDVVVPPKYPVPHKELIFLIKTAVSAKWENHFCIIKVDTSYV